MTFSFNPLWKILIDKGMTKEDLRTALKLSPSTIAKMSKGEYVSMRVVDKVCSYFGVQPGDLLIHVPDEKGEKES